MKNQYDSYILYTCDRNTPMNCRLRFVMKDEIDSSVMEKAVGITMPRFPYFSVRAEVNENQSYVLVHNDAPVAVLKDHAKLPAIGSAEVNRHLLFVSYLGREVYFNINHTFGMGHSFFHWAISVLYQYVTMKYGVSLNCPSILKPDSSIPDDELWEPSLENIPEEEPLFLPKKQESFFPLKDYLNGMLNPFQKFHSYYAFTFDQKDFVGLAKNHDSSVNSLMVILMFKALAKILPENEKKIVGGVSARTAPALGHPLAHGCFVRQLHINLDRKQAGLDLTELGTITRGQMVLQLDESNSIAETRSLIQYYSAIDEQKTLKDKKKYAVTRSPLRGSDAIMNSFVVSYSGNFDLGDLAEYIDSYYAISDGHLMLEVTAKGDKIYLAFQQMIRNTKYVDAFKAVLEENGISYQVEGPFKKNLPPLAL